jgi:hypothetical protein
MARYAKGIIAILAGLGVIASSGLLDGAAEAWVNTIIAAVGAVLVVLIPNAQLPSQSTGQPPSNDNPPTAPESTP